jgi:CubicO group peptidase (beta-lactamase class C family)
MIPTLLHEVELKNRLDLALESAVRSQRIVGAVVLVARDGNLVYRNAVGMMDREAGIPMREDAVFRIASCTKAIVSTAAMVLVDQGRIRLDDPVTKWLPGFRPKAPDGSIPVITIRNLMTHTAGLTYGFAEPASGPYHQLQVSDGSDQPGLSLAENVGRIGRAPLLNRPGAAWHYSLATDVLGAVLEKASGESLPSLVQRTVTGPIGMRDTHFHFTSSSRVAKPYAPGIAGGAPQPMGKIQFVPFAASGLSFVPERNFVKGAYPSGGGGMVGTAEDFMLFLETLRKGGDLLLGKDSFQALTTNAIGDLPVEYRPGWGWSLGFSILKDPVAARTRANAGTWQWGGVYGSHWWVDPKAELTVVVFTNTAVTGMTGPFPEEIRAAVYGPGK